MSPSGSGSTLALLGGTPTGPVAPEPHPRFTPDVIDRVSDLLRRGCTVGLNKHVAEIREAEESIAAWQGVSHCLGTSSGHAALHCCLMGLEISSGDEVITTPYTWGASTSCILHNNAIPVFADVCPETGLLDPATIEERVTPRTRAILAVHIFGQPANMSAIRAIANRHGLVVIEDGSQAHGALHQNQKVGTFGDASGFSCMGGKLLASSEAGYMVTPRADVYWKASLCTQHMGRSSEPGFPEDLLRYVDSLVYTYRLSPINAVLLTAQLRKIDAENQGRRRNVAHFRQAMAGVESARFPSYAEGDDPVYHMLTMNFCPEVAGVSRDTYLAALHAEGVGIFAYVPSPIPTWPRLNWQTYTGPRVMWTESLRQSGVDYRTMECPNAHTKVARSLEMSWNYIEEDPERIQRLAAAFWKVEENLGALREWERRGA
ncbi:MAG TPA: DegT/DnrJ/EryC1/StrS family aminotransferase [Armatimonadota bacterium]|nr:DegT/DnrJ/EryC1/StrS family aminotransferase [Armatimonadota bacterium]